MTKLELIYNAGNWQILLNGRVVSETPIESTAREMFEILRNEWSAQ